MTKVYDLCWREESAGIVGCKHPTAGRRVLILLGKDARKEPSKLMSIRNARLGFAPIIGHPGKAPQPRAKSHG